MIYINILTYLDHSLFEQQCNFDNYAKNYTFFENSNLDIEWDFVVVFEAINKPINVRHRNGGLIFISGEPPLGSVYTQNFLKQFDIIFSVHTKNPKSKKVIKKQYFNDWHFGLDKLNMRHRYTFNELKNLKKPDKTKNISIITSSLAVLPFHFKRLNFISELKKTFGDDIDYFGRGFNFINDKSDAILPYRFHICIENNFTNDLWTEKFADPLLGYSIPIYIGCPNITNYFPKDSFYILDINDIKSSISTIKKILSDAESYYDQKYKSLISARNLLLDEYNIYPTLINLYINQKNNLGGIISSKIIPNSYTTTFKSLNLKLRIIRFTYKIYYQLLRKFK